MVRRVWGCAALHGIAFRGIAGLREAPLSEALRAKAEDRREEPLRRLAIVHSDRHVQQLPNISVAIGGHTSIQDLGNTHPPADRSRHLFPNVRSPSRIQRNTSV